MTRIIVIMAFGFPAFVQAQFSVGFTADKSGTFHLYEPDAAIPAILVDSSDAPVVHTVATLFANDYQQVTGTRPAIGYQRKSQHEMYAIIGSVGQNRWIDSLAAQGLLDVQSLAGKWEQFKAEVIEHPFPGVKKALIIAGSDARGAAYGTLRLSEKIGVSPWYWWADVPIRQQTHLNIDVSGEISGSPSVKYRGIFLNDEDWGLHPWASKKMDTTIETIGPKTYEKIFELVLRLKGNVVVPAMHSCTRAFYSIPENLEVAEKYGMVMSTSHCEPLLYNNASEWDASTDGAWSYETNRDRINQVLTQRVKQAANHENIYTIALRGIHDEPMKISDPRNRGAVLSQAIADQRTILKKELELKLDQIPQIFVPYKEVLEVYNDGLAIPDDVTIVWPDDNYGYLRQLRTHADDRSDRKMGIYYHLSYLGWPHDYLWLYSTPPALMYEELYKAYKMGANHYWVANAGDIKPCEPGIDAFMEMAWDIDQFNTENVSHHTANKLAEIFGEQYAQDFQHLFSVYFRLAFTRRPEFMTGIRKWNSLYETEIARDTDFSFIHYQEAEQRLRSYREIANKAKYLLEQQPGEYHNAFYQLIFYPIKSASLYNHVMLVAQQNRWYATQGRSLTNQLADHVKLYQDSIAYYTQQYQVLDSSKWEHIITAPGFLPEPHLPPLASLTFPDMGEMDVFVQGTASVGLDQYTLPIFYEADDSRYFFDVYNRGAKPFHWRATTSHPAIQLSSYEGKPAHEERIQVHIDWEKLAPSDTAGFISVVSNYRTKTITVRMKKTDSENNDLHTERNGVISISPDRYHHKSEGIGSKVSVLEGFGYTGSVLQLGQAWISNDLEHCSVSYDFSVEKPGNATIYTYMIPAHGVSEENHCAYQVEVDDQVVATHDNHLDGKNMVWANQVLSNSTIDTTFVHFELAGKHTLKLTALDPGVMVQKVLIDLGGLKPSYAGPICR